RPRQPGPGRLRQHRQLHRAARRQRSSGPRPLRLMSSPVVPERSAADALPYFLGCPSWNELAWRGSFYPDDLRPADTLARYCATFNAVEGNTTFYARPGVQTVQRWAEQMPPHFRFCAKLPRDISHAGDLREHFAATADFLALLAPLGARVAPLWLQLPASFGPSRLGELLAWLDEFADRRMAVELRHPGFFAR